jgi:sarcosine oxidase subunit delta
MMHITCPWCGKRPENEFNCGGTTAIQRPPLDCDDETWATYMFSRDNPLGLHAERWRHTHGCSQWFNMVRDTLTHEIRAVYGMTAPQPDVESVSP